MTPATYQPANDMSVETFNLRWIQDEMPRAFILSVEGQGGGANLYGPFKTVREAKEFGPRIDAQVYTIDEAVTKFCDEDND